MAVNGKETREAGFYFGLWKNDRVMRGSGKDREGSMREGENLPAKPGESEERKHGAEGRELLADWKLGARSDKVRDFRVVQTVGQYGCGRSKMEVNDG